MYRDVLKCSKYKKCAGDVIQYWRTVRDSYSSTVQSRHKTYQVPASTEVTNKVYGINVGQHMINCSCFLQTGSLVNHLNPLTPTSDLWSSGKQHGWPGQVKGT